MRRRRGHQITRGCPTPLLGLLFVVLFLGHDALMAAAAVAHVPQPIAAQHHAAAAHALVERSAPDSRHPEHCSISQTAILRSTQDAPPAEQARSVIVQISTPAKLPVLADGSFRWEEPHWPPGTWRAIFQMYRL